WQRHLSFRGATPGIQSRFQLNRQLLHRRHEIVRLARIIFEVVEFQSPIFEKFDQLEVTGTNSTRGFSTLIAIMRIMPEKVRSIKRSALLQQWQQADAIEYLVGRWFDAADFEKRRNEVNAGNWRGTHRPALHDTRPANNQRHANAALVKVAFSCAQREI